MGNSLTLTIAGIAMMVFAATETHAAGFAFGTQNYYFQLYDGEQYTYSVTPYTYVSDDYYYFDYPFRFYNGASYYYFQPGWYNFNPSFYLYPYADYYSYYPSTYYYYNSDWVYSPNWLYTYGPMYYGNYYYPPQQATLTGSQYKPVKEADCSEVSLTTQDFIISSGETKTITINIYNGSPKYLDIQNVMVFIDGPDVEARNVKFDSTVIDGTNGSITFDTFAASNPLNQNAKGTVKVYGTFRDGTSCSGNDISQDFTISIDRAQNQQAVPSSSADISNKYSSSGTMAMSYGSVVQSPQQAPYQQPQHGNSVDVTIQNFMFSPSTITIRGGDTVTWTNMDSTAHTVTSDQGNELGSGELATGSTYEHTFTHAGTYNYHCSIHPAMKGTIVVQDPGTVPSGRNEPMPTMTTPPNTTGYAVIGSSAYHAAKASQQHWVETEPSAANDYGSISSNNDMGTASFSGTTNAMDYGQKQRIETSCSGLSITTENLSVSTGSTNYNYALLKNYGGEDFAVDRIQAVSGSAGNFALEVTRDSQKVYSGQAGAIKVKVLATNIDDYTASAYLAVDGHYGSGTQCKVLSDNFLVHVNAAERTPLGKVSLEAPSRTEISGTSGFVTIKYENNSNEDATITASSKDAGVTPNEVVVTAHTRGSRTFAVNGFDATKGGRVDFIVSAGGGLQITERYVELVKGPTAQSTGASNPSATSKPIQSAAPLQKINNLVGAGLAVFTTGNMLLNAIVLLLLVVAAWAIYRHSQK